MKNTKRSLLLSALALVMCVAMLIGSTFAWFTDSASTAVNSIVSGTLDIAIEKEDGTNLEGSTLKFVAKDGKTDVLWEPGVTFNTEPFYIVNNGNLNLKFRLDIVGAAGDVELLDVISFTAIGAGVNYLTAGEVALAPKAKIGPVVITGVMDKNAGNEYQGKTVTGLAISIVATQDTVEFDSISNEYDKDAVNMSPVQKLPEASKDMTFGTKGDKPVSIDLPKEVIDDLKDAGVTSMSLIASDPKEEVINGKESLVFDTVEFVNQDGRVIDTEALDLDEFTISLPTSYAEGTEVVIYHDGKVMKAAAVGANGTLTYTATHLCEIVLQTGSTPVADGVLKENKTGHYEIYNANGMLWVEAQADAFFAGNTVKLISDIDMFDVAMKPIRFWDPERPTTFDGQGYTIYDLDISSNPDTNNQALFNGTATIKNLTVDGAWIEGKGYTAVIASTLYGNIDNCHVKNAQVFDGYWTAGAIVAQFNSGNITNCTAENCDIYSGSAVGAIVGRINETAGTRKVENCKVINCTIAKNGGFGGNYDLMFGAISGCIYVDNLKVYYNNCTVENTTVLGQASDSVCGWQDVSNEIYIDGVKQ